MRDSRGAHFGDWVVQLCQGQGLPVPDGFAELGVSLPEPPLHPEFRDLVRAYEWTLQCGGRRKGMGVYYTPPELVECLLETALEPCLMRCRQQPDPAAAMLGLRVLDPACGAGDFLLAAARRVARAVAALPGGGGRRAEGEILREVIRQGVYGVDQDPVAVELTRLNVYLSSGVWLGDHAACGNALVGVRRRGELMAPVPDGAYEPLAGDDREVARALRRLNRECARGSVPGAGRGGADAHEKEAADLLTAAFLLPKRPGVAVPLTAHLRACLRGELPPASAEWLAAQEICRRERVWHWLGAFGACCEGRPALPQFDCVLGNPPWEKLLLSEREWAAAQGIPLHRERGAGSPPGASRAAEPPAFCEARQRLSALAHYLHTCPERLPASCSGIVNLYAPFLWLSLQLCTRHGRVGMVVPTGLMSDRGTLPMFHALHGGGHLRHFYDFENRELLFPGVDRRQRFACVTLSAHPSEAPARFAFFLRRPEELRENGRVAELDATVFRRLNPGTHGGVSFRCAADARLALAVHERLPLLGEAWPVELRQGILNMTADRGLFRRAPEAGTLPLYEGRMFHLFEPRFGGYGADGCFRESTPEQLADPCWIPGARYHVARDAVLARLPEGVAARGWIPVFRMVTSPTNERSFICSIMPVGGVGNSAGLLMVREADPRLILCLVAQLSSLVFDYQVRMKLSGINLNFHIVSQLPVLPPAAYTEGDRRYIAQRLLSLVYTTHSLDALADSCGLPRRPYPYTGEEQRAACRAELEAWYARRCGLSREEFAYILDPAAAPGLPGNAPSASTFAIMRTRELTRWGRYRTAELSLAAYDALAASEN